MEKFLVVKIGSSPIVEFYEEHLNILRKYGYVDFARFGAKKIARKDYSHRYIFIKESASCGGRLIKAYLEEGDNCGEHYPKYYDETLIYTVTWFRIKKMEIMEKEDFLNNYMLVNGNEIKALEKGTVSFFYVVKR